MDKLFIIKKVENILNRMERNSFQDVLVSSTSDVVEKFMINTAKRLLKTYDEFTQGLCGDAQYIVSIRNFMLVYQTELILDELNKDTLIKYGIYYNTLSLKYYAAYDIPNYIKHDNFIINCFIKGDTRLNENKSKYSLETNGYIKDITGFNKFKSFEQKLCVYGGLNTPAGYTCLVSMSTGGGKSLVTQTICCENSGLSIVVVPTVSLAIDQERTARKNLKTLSNEEIFCYYSGINNQKEIYDSINNHKAKLLFISPEALIKNEKFKEVIKNVNNDRYLKNIIIDEAHIVISWGNFFRVDYQCLSPWRRELMRYNPDIRTFLLSATFSDNTVTSLKKMFSEGDKWIEIRCDSLRKEPSFIVTKCKNRLDKKRKVLELVNKLPRPLIIYVESPYTAKYWKEYLENNKYKNIRMFTGETKANQRKQLIDGWAEDEYDLIVATSAFGIGVDKSDVRTVLHLNVPESPDEYYQQLGRGGRDGLPCLSVMCIEEEDVSKAYKHVSKVLTIEKLKGRWFSMYNNPENIWQNGKMAIMASTKPNYNKENYFEDGNDTDEKWNINVLLLLNRYNLIDIVGLDMDQSNRYIFTIKILDETIVNETDDAIDLLSSIREKEFNRLNKAFMLMKNAIENSESRCWSQMFYDTYPLVSEYCSGCNYHEDIECDELNRFPLLVELNKCTKTISDKVKELFVSTKEMLVLDLEEIDTILNNYKPNIVISESFDRFKNIKSPNLIMMNFSELRAYISNNAKYYVSGLIVVMYSSNEKEALKQYSIVSKLLNNDTYIIHVSEKDFEISGLTRKKISERIDGAVIK